MIFGFVLLCATTACDGMQANPVANHSAVVLVGQNTRVTVLTPRILRIENKDNSMESFRDAATLTFINRNVPVPEFTVHTSNSTGEYECFKNGALTLHLGVTVNITLASQLSLVISDR